MARIRSIKPEFWSSEQVMECSPMARLLFIGLWNFCDDAGNHSLSVRTIKAEVFPGDDIASENIRQLLDELSSNGLIAYYSHENKDFLHVTGWQHQKIERPTFKHPPYMAQSPEGTRRHVDDSSPPEWKGEEGRGEEGKGEEGSAEGNLELTLDSQGEQSSPASPATLIPKEIQIVLDVYHRLLPRCQRIAVLNDKRRKRMQVAIKLAKQVCQEQGWLYDAEVFWAAYFDECAKDPWLRGERPNPNNPSWKQNLDVLLAEDRFAGIMDRAIAAMQGAA